MSRAARLYQIQCVDADPSEKTKLLEEMITKATEKEIEYAFTWSCFRERWKVKFVCNYYGLRMDWQNWIEKEIKWVDGALREYRDGSKGVTSSTDLISHRLDVMSRTRDLECTEKVWSAEQVRTRDKKLIETTLQKRRDAEKAEWDRKVYKIR